MTKKDNNQVIWEEFVSQNKIKKNYSRGGSISSDVLEEFRSHPKADIKTQPLERKQNCRTTSLNRQVIKQKPFKTFSREEHDPATSERRRFFFG